MASCDGSSRRRPTSPLPKPRDPPPPIYVGHSIFLLRRRPAAQIQGSVASVEPGRASASAYRLSLSQPPHLWRRRQQRQRKQLEKRRKRRKRTPPSSSSAPWEPTACLDVVGDARIRSNTLDPATLFSSLFASYRAFADADPLFLLEIVLQQAWVEN